MLPRCGRVAHICEANRTVEWNCNKNLGENRKESQLPSKSEGCNEIQGFRGNCDSQGKLGMCPSLAEPNSSGFPRSNVSRETWHESNIEIGLQYTSRRQLKSFLIQQFFKNAGEVWASSPHLRSKLDFWDLFFLLQLHFLKLSNSNKVESWESRL